ncbi:hypothetical protein [Acidovorax bellezanensis]|nr:hypothetical protein [Acidovorax sp. Be4]
MWLEIDESLVDLYPTATASQCAALEAIALSVFHGKNSLYAKKRTLEWICAQQLSQAAKSVCLRIKNRLSEYASLRDFIKIKIIVVSSDRELSFNDAGLWELPLSALENNPISTCTLLAENLSDADIYLIAAEHYRRHNKINGLITNLTPIGGGGNQIYPAFLRFVDRKETFCLSVTDTDKDYPSAESNDASKSCKALAGERRWIADHIDVPARELENILPVNIVEDAIFNDDGCVELHERFSKVKGGTENSPDALLYCDLKKGTKFLWAGDAHGNKDKARFWTDFLGSKNPPINGCGNGCNEKCECFMIESLGERIAEKFLEHCRKISGQKQYERMKTSANADQWLEVGKVVFDWGVAIPRSRT